MARPVVVTSGALEGIDAIPGREVVLADDATAFAAACIDLATGSFGADIGQAARECVIRQYNWAARLSRYDEFLCPTETPA